MMTRAHVFISGKVQGVFFRMKTRYAAVKRGVKGWIRNLSDGRVEAVFEGKREKVERLVEFCRKGSQRARVVKVEVLWEQYTGEFGNFHIL